MKDMPKTADSSLHKIKNQAQALALRHLLGLLVHASDKNLIRLTYWFENLTADPAVKRAAQGVRELFKQKHPGVRLIRRLLRDTDPHCRKKLLANLILNGFAFNQQKRTAAAARGECVPTTILISPTMRCNLNCVGCYAANYGKADDLPVEVFDRIIREGQEAGVAFFTILGGEPFFYQDLFEIFKKHPDVYFQVYTNGTLLTEETVKKIVSLGNVLPIVSVEGFQAETDARRGAGVYERALQAMALLQRYRAPFGFSVAVTNKNVELVSGDEFIDFMIKQGAVLGWYFLYMPVGKSPDLSLMPTPLQRRLLKERVEHIRDTKPIFIVDFWNDAPFVGGCIAGKEYIHITSRGDVEPCIFTHFAVDNIKEKSLKEVMNSGLFRELRRRQPYNDNLYLPCMWIDNPQVSREVFAQYHAYVTHPGADDILNDPDIRKGVDDYAQNVGKIYQDVWEKFTKQKK